MLRIAIAEDEERHLIPLIKEVTAYQKNEINIVAKNGLELLMALQNTKHLPDILLLDIKMPKIDGLIITQYLTYY